MTCRKLILAAAFSLWAGLAAAQGVIGPANQVICNKVVTFSSISTLTQLVAPVTGQAIFICGWHVTNTSATAASFVITTGTQTTNPCDTGTVTITPALSVLNSAPSADHIDYAVGQSKLSQALCVLPSSTTLAGLIYYSQF